MSKKKEEVTYRISVREPSWEKWTMLWYVFDFQEDADNYIKEIAPTYPEGTLLFITGIWPYPPKGGSDFFTRKAYIVDEWGHLKSMPRKWIRSGRIPREWLDAPPEYPKPEAPFFTTLEPVLHPAEELGDWR